MTPRDTADRPHLGLLLAGGVGDFILAARFWRDFLHAVGDITFDVYCEAHPAIAEALFCGMPGFSTLHTDNYRTNMQSYKYFLAAGGLLFTLGGFDIDRTIANKGLIEGGCTADQIVYNIASSIQNILAIAQNHPRLDGALSQYARYKNRNRRDFFHFMAGIEYGGDTLDIEFTHESSACLRFESKGYITIHNGFDAAFGSGAANISTKSYYGWHRVITELRSLGVFLPIIQIGSPTTSISVEGVDDNLIGRTSLIQAMNLVKGAAFHLDGESGFVHFAAAIGVKSAVVFGPTPIEYFAYPLNENIEPEQCGGCWWSEPTWMSVCPRGFEVPLCMASHDPLKIASRIAKAISKSETDAPPRTEISSVAETHHGNSNTNISQKILQDVEGRALDPYDVKWCYTTLLGREPENNNIIAHWLCTAKDRQSLIEIVMSSDEYKNRMQISSAGA